MRHTAQRRIHGHVLLARRAALPERRDGPPVTAAAGLQDDRPPRYLGINDAAFDANKQISFAWSTATPARWNYGDRTARCYLMLEGNLSVSRSLRGNGNVPI